MQNYRAHSQFSKQDGHLFAGQYIPVLKSFCLTRKNAARILSARTGMGYRAAYRAAKGDFMTDEVTFVRKTISGHSGHWVSRIEELFEEA